MTTPITPPTASAAPAGPDRADRTTFSIRATAAFDYVKNVMWADMAAFVANCYANTVIAFNAAAAALASENAAGTSVTAAAASANSAATSASASAASAGAATWANTGATYAVGDLRKSPGNSRIYRRLTASNAGTTDPSIDTTNWASWNLDPVWQKKTGNYSAIAGDALLCDTTGGSFAVALPATPAANETVRIADYIGTFSTNKLTIGRNGAKINGIAEDMDIATNWASIVLTYIDATVGWRAPL